MDVAPKDGTGWMGWKSPGGGMLRAPSALTTSIQDLVKHNLQRDDVFNGIWQFSHLELVKLFVEVGLQP